MQTGQVSVTGTIIQIIGANPSRSVCWIIGTGDFFFGPSGVTASTGMLVKSGVPFPVDSLSSIFGITSGGSITVSYVDIQ